MEQTIFKIGDTICLFASLCSFKDNYSRSKVANDAVTLTLNLLDRTSINDNEF